MTGSPALRILILEDSPDDLLLMLHELKHGGVNFVYECVDSEKSLLKALEQPWDIVLSDYAMPGFSGPDALEIIKDHGLDIPFIIVSAMLGEEAAVEAMRAGANDFFIKGKTSRLIPAIEREVSDARERQQRQWAELRLRESEERFAKAFYASPVAISVTTMDEGIFVDVNDAYLRMFGYERSDLISKRVSDLNIRLRTDDRIEMVENLLTKGAIHDRETTLRARDGSLRYTLASMVRIELGRQDCVLAMIFDMTERRLAETAEREQRAFAHALSEVAALLARSLDLTSVTTGIIAYVGNVVPHDAASVMLLDGDGAFVAYAQGYPAADARQVENAHFPLDLPLFQPMLALKQPGLTADFASPSPWSALPGHAWVKSTISSPITAHNTVIGFLVLHRKTASFSLPDVEHLRAFADQAAIALYNAQLYSQVQEHADELERRVDKRTLQLRQAKEHVETILNSTNDAIFLARPDGTIEQSNPAFAALFGQSAAHFGTIVQLVTPDQAEILTAQARAVAASSTPAHVDLICHSASGDAFDAEIAIAPAVAFLTQTPTLICSVRDITRRKGLETELRAALAQEKELRELKSRFVSMISHEFRTPLAAIQSSSDVLRNYYDRLDSERREAQFDSIQTQVQHLAHLLDDILTISRSETVGLEFRPMPTDLQQLSEGLIDEIKQVDDTHAFELVVEGDCHDAILDVSLMRRTLLNLLSNAVKYSPPATSVMMRLSNVGDIYQIEVRDRGIGIPEEDLPHLFQIFHRGSNVGRTPGSGLGLALAKLAVEAHGGTISLSSHVGQGTSFIVRIPHVKPRE